MTARHRFGAFPPLLQALLALLPFVLLPGAAPTTARAATISWNNAAGGDWNTDINWLGGFKPGPGDVARIALGGGFTVTLSGAATVAGLELGSLGGAEVLAINGGTLTVNGPATTTATARITLAGGTLNGSGLLTLDGVLEARGASSIGLPLAVTGTGTLRAIGSSGGAGVLTLANGFTNSGKLELTNDVAGANATLNVTSGSLVVAFGAQLRSLAGAGGGTRTLGASLNNQGTLDLSHPLSIAKSGAAHLNSGTINVSGGDLTVTQSGASPSFGTSGTITIGAGRTLTVSGGAFDQTAGGITGATGTLALGTVAATFTSALSTANLGLSPTNCTLDGAALTNASGKTLTLTGDIVNMTVTNAGTLVAHGSNSFTGGLTTQNGSTLRVEGSATGPGTLTITGQVTNNGTLELTSSGAAQDATLNFISGSLTNAPGRTLSALAGAGGNRALGGALNNQGQLMVNAPLALNVPGADHLNSGAITLGAGDLTVTQSGATPSFGTSGTITLGAGRTLTVTGGAFSQTAGTIGGATGSLTLTNAAVTLTPGFTAGACFLNLVGCTLGGGTLTIPAAKLLTLRDDTINTTVSNSGTLALDGVCALNGTFLQQAGATLRVEGSGFGAADATIAAGFTNNGTIDITTNSLGQNAALTVTSGTLINATGREIKSTLGSGGGTRALNAQLDNRGLVTVGATLGVTRASAAHLNSGTVKLTGGSLTFSQSGGASLVNSGTLTIGTTRALTLDAGTFTNAAGGILQGSGTLNVSGVAFHNAGTIRPGTSPGVLTVTGDLICDPTSLLVLELGGVSPGSGYDRLAVSGAVTLDGALQLALISGFVPAGGSTFNVIQWGGHTGDFSSVTGLDPLPGVELAADPPGHGYGATGLTFVVLTQTWAPLTPGGTAPTARAGASAVYDAVNNRLIVFGGRATGGPQNDVRILVNANGLGGTPTWVALSPTGSPPTPRQGHGALYDAANNRMIVFGGDNGQAVPTLFSDVWVLSGANGLAGAGAWTPLAPGGSAPGARTQAAVAYNAASNRLVVFGGQGAAGCDARNDLHVLTNANGLGGAPTWLAPAVAGTAPSVRARAGATFDAAGNRLIVYGGDGLCGAPLTDAFVLTRPDANGGTPTWAPLALTNAPAPGISGADGGFDPAFDRMVTFGGRRGNGTTLGDDTIMLFDANGAGAPPRWSLLPPTLPRPAARWRQASAYDAANHRLIVFGGDTSISTPSPLNDVWVLTVNVANDAVSAVDDPPTPGDRTTGGFLSAPTPNPTTGALSFSLGVPEAGRVSVALFDVRGRRVRALCDGELTAGPAEFAWDGRDDGGTRVAAGVYFLRATTLAGSAVRRVVVVP